jgi:hypothetical protein
VSDCFVTRIMGVLLRLGGEACRLILVRRLIFTRQTYPVTP